MAKRKEFNPDPNDSFLRRRIIYNTKYSINGLVSTFKNEEAFRIEIFLALIMIPLGFYLAPEGVSRLLLIGSIVLVLIVELLNTGLENLVDRVSLEKHELSGRVKDQGSAAVFLSICLCGFVWIMILFF
ncbi:MAG: diacylglycerol kinase [Desulfocapsa sp.]|nr:diacylglycerol kinase [Desulfocapsa sp.]MBL4904379.1 diacylglycerol kinase [Desulfocapsa sp.]